jgi:hypothetical protein
MNQPEYVAILRENRFLRSREECLAFDNAIFAMSPDSDPHLLSELLLIFEDNCEHFEVMWSLLHFVEDFDDQLGTDTLLSMTPQMLIQAADWCMLLHRRTLNNPETRKYYLEKLQQLSQQERDSIKELFQDELRNLEERKEDLTLPEHVRILETIHYIDTLANG